MKLCHPPPLVLLIILVCLLAIVLAAIDFVYQNAAAKRGAEALHAGETAATFAESAAEFAPLLLLGGAVPSRKTRVLESKNIVVDTLNLTHWLQRRAPLKMVETCTILAAIERTAPIIRRSYPGRIIYVTKDRETPATKERAERLRALYQATARRCGVYVNVVERLPNEKDDDAHDGAHDGAPRRRRGKSHAALGRDDFYLIMLAWKYNSPVLSRDRFRDLADMKAGLDPFHVYIYSPVKTLPERDFVNPAAAEFQKMRRPAAVDYPSVLPHQ